MKAKVEAMPIPSQAGQEYSEGVETRGSKREPLKPPRARPTLTD
ncbi:hypothetical protein [Bacillus wiedmannii]|nr:hypothetical protein [Bacillus wiedmannii]